MRRVALITLGTLALAAPALANVNGGAVQSGAYSGGTSQGKTVKFSFANASLHGFHLQFKLSCQSGLTVSGRTNISKLGPISGKHASITVSSSGPITLPNGSTGHFNGTELISVHFPSSHSVAGTYSSSETVHNSSGASVDSCAIGHVSWAASHT